jgi:hypothetical protein
MKDREINIKVTNITPKQWTNLVIELIYGLSPWKPYGPKIKLKLEILIELLNGEGVKMTIGKNRRSGSKLESNEESEI